MKISTTKKFEKDLEKAKKQRKDLAKLVEIMEILADEKPMPRRYRNHKLKGNFVDRWECHINPDWLLIYRKTKNELRFERLGSHSELFR